MTLHMVPSSALSFIVIMRCHLVYSCGATWFISVHMTCSLNLQGLYLTTVHDVQFLVEQCVVPSSVFLLTHVLPPGVSQYT